MNIFLTIIAVLLMLGAVAALVRGIIAFLKTTEADLNHVGDGPSPNQLKQNKMMMNRIIFQGLAVLVLAVLIMSSRG